MIMICMTGLWSTEAAKVGGRGCRIIKINKVAHWLTFGGALPLSFKVRRILAPIPSAVK